MGSSWKPATTVSLKIEMQIESRCMVRQRYDIWSYRIDSITKYKYGKQKALGNQHYWRFKNGKKNWGEIGHPTNDSWASVHQTTPVHKDHVNFCRWYCELRWLIGNLNINKVMMDCMKRDEKFILVMIKLFFLQSVTNRPVKIYRFFWMDHVPIPYNGDDDDDNEWVAIASK